MSESVSWAVLTPLVMLCVLGLLQLGLWLHGLTTVRSAAATGADLAAYSDPVGSAEQGALGVAAAGGLEQVQVRVEQSDAAVTVQVSASVPLLFDLGLSRVQATSRAPRERVTRP